MHQIVRAVKFCCLGDSPLEKITIGGATSEPTVLQPPWFYVLGKYTWNIEDDLLNMRSILHFHTIGKVNTNNIKSGASLEAQ